MNEYDFDSILTKKIELLEKWLKRLHRELYYLKQVAVLNNENKSKKAIQLEIFKKSG